MKSPLNIRVGIALSIVGVALAAISVFRYAWDAFHGVKAIGGDKAMQIVILCLWIVVPPVWF